MLGALDYILPREYTSVLKAFHDDAPGSTFEEIKMVSGIYNCSCNCHKCQILYFPIYIALNYAFVTINYTSTDAVKYWISKI